MHDELPLGEPVDWTPAARPQPVILRGDHVLLRPVEPEADAASLYAASHPLTGDASLWAYLSDGPYESPKHLAQMLARSQRAEDRLYFSLVPAATGEPAGIASYLRAKPEMGSIEVGHIWFGAGLARSTAATEALYLLARHAFDSLGYRRLEWKCDALNAASRRAAERFGFAFEGIFRSHQVVKGRNRDTAWYAITDADWPGVRARLERWLQPANFDSEGCQRRPLRGYTEPWSTTPDPRLVARRLGWP